MQVLQICLLIALLLIVVIGGLLRKRRVFINENAEAVRVRNIVQSMRFSPNSYFVTNDEELIIWVNKRAEKVFGDERTLKTRFITDLISPTDLASFEQFTKEKHMLDSDEEHHLEVTAIDKDGKEFISDIISGKWFDETKQFTFYTFIIRDISHRKANEESHRRLYANFTKECELMEQEEKLLKSGAWHWDLTKKPDEVRYTSGFSKLFDVPKGQVVTGTILMQIVHEDDRPAVNEAMKNMLLHGTPYTIQYRIVRRNARNDLINCIADPIFNENNHLIQIVGVITLIKEDVG